MSEYIRHFPMTPLGGMFVLAVGVGVIFGGLVPRFRMASVWLGLGFAVLAITFLGGRLSPARTPSQLQVDFLVLAIVLEFVAFVVLMPRIRPAGPRTVVLGTLAIVGTHFIVMLPALGPLIGILGVLCLLNTALLWRMPTYSINRAWLVDGTLKLSLGATMLFINSA